MKRHRMTFNSERGKLRLARILALLENGPMATREIAAALHMDRSGVTDYLAHLMRDPRRVRIAEYHTISGAINGNRQPLYGLGAEPDVPLTRIDNVERWNRVKAKPQLYAKSLEDRKKHHRRKRDAVPPELRKRERRRLDEPLEPLILALLAEVPGYDTTQIAVKLRAGKRSVRTALEKLRAAGSVRVAANASSKAYRFERPDNPLPPPLAAGQPKHSWAAALGV